MTRFSFFFSDLRHPNILLLMAVYDSTDPLKRGVVLEPVERCFLRTLLLENKTVFDEDTVHSRRALQAVHRIRQPAGRTGP